MSSIRAHFDGRVFVPDEAVSLQPGTAVVVTGVVKTQAAPSADFLRPVLFPPDPAASVKFLDDPETNLENY
ncbi:MAG: hypothetical protein SGJ20_12235 [Planctomycetota bacterium]|nr:hypothetical protein [Planctomycetota bacterium]